MHAFIEQNNFKWVFGMSLNKPVNSRKLISHYEALQRHMIWWKEIINRNIEGKTFLNSKKPKLITCKWVNKIGPYFTILIRSIDVYSNGYSCCYVLLFIDCTLLYVKLITFYRLYDKLSTNIQRQLGQYEKTPANMENLSQYEIQPIRCKN